MKIIMIVLGMILSVSMQGYAAESGSPLMNQPVMRQNMHGDKVRCYKATGVVIKVDRDNGNVTIFYDAVPALMWPPMTMPFAVSDKTLFDRLKVGEKIEFEFVLEKRTGLIVAVK